MASKQSGKKAVEPMIRFDGEWIPAHDLWGKMETVNVVADAIARFNEKFPELASDQTRDVVPLVRQRLKDIELRMPDETAQPDLAPIATHLMRTMPPEDVIAVLREKHNAELDIAQLIQLAGDDAYSAALLREASVFAMNMISPEQTADLWNDTTRPAPGGGLWTAKKVQDLLDGGA